MVKGTLVPEFASGTETWVSAAASPALLVLLVTAEVATGLVVVQVKGMVQLLSFLKITQVEVAGVRVPDMPAHLY